MRLFIKVGFVPSQTSLPTVQAAADEEPGPIGRWFSANLDIRSVLALLTLGSTLVAGFVEIRVTQRDQAAEIADVKSRLARLNARVTEDTVNRVSYEHDTNQISRTLDNLASGQQQIFTLLIQQNRKDHP